MHNGRPPQAKNELEDSIARRHLPASNKHEARHAVIVSLHSHEPSNASDAPAEFVRRFAHNAIAAGAALVVVRFCRG